MRRHQRGALVVLVGPDGVGKTSVASSLLDVQAGSARYFHFCPPLFGNWRSEPEPGRFFPKAEDESSQFARLLGWFRILRRLFVFWAGYLTSVRPALQAGQLVVADRWAYGYLADPSPLRFYGPRWLAGLVIRLLPRPDLIACLEAPVEVIHQRKAELSLDEIEAQLLAWRAIPDDRVVVLSSTGPPRDVAQSILQYLGHGTG